jgi:hypothetical protein
MLAEAELRRIHRRAGDQENFSLEISVLLLSCSSVMNLVSSLFS